MDYEALRNVADNLITQFSNGQTAVLLKGIKVKDASSGKVTKTFREVAEDARAVMTNYSEEAISKSEGVVKAGDVKFIARFSEEPTEVEDRIRYAGSDYNIIHYKAVNPTGTYAVTYVIQGRKA